MVTAKIQCTAREETGDGQVRLEFQPDYEDGRNKDWAKYTPGLSLNMVVKEEVAGHFERGGRYTLAFSISDEPGARAVSGEKLKG